MHYMISIGAGNCAQPIGDRAMQKNFKAAAGRYRVFHVGPRAYTIEAEGKIVGERPNLSTAFALACRLHEADKAAEKGGEQ
jgi:hypothetical protein